MSSRSASRHSSPSSPGFFKSHYENSPINRKRNYNSLLEKVSRISEKSPKFKGSPGEYRKSNHHEISLADTDWSKHISSTGKTYYYNRVTEESQWEFPADLLRREKRPSDKPSLKSKDSSSRTLSRSYHRSSSDHDQIREKNRDRDYRSEYKRSRYKDDERRHSKYGRSSSSSSGSYKSYTPEQTRSSGSYKNGSSDSKTLERSHSNSSGSSKGGRSAKQLFSKDKIFVNGGDSTVQDITPPGTPTNDDTLLSFSSVSPLSFNKKTIFTNNIITNNPPCIYIPPQVQPTPHNPMSLSHPNIATASLLHPLQQALLLHQQHIPQEILKRNEVPSSSSSTTFPTFLQDPRTVHVNTDKHMHRNQMEVSSYSPFTNTSQLIGITPNAIQTLPVQNQSNSLQHDLPPPPPPKADVDRTELRSRNSPRRFGEIKGDIQREHKEQSNVCKSSSDVEKSITHHSEKLLRESQMIFPDMPEIQQYMQFCSTNVNNEALNAFGFIFDKQANISFNEAMTVVNDGGFLSKSVLQLSQHNFDVKSIADDVSTQWTNALDTVMSSVENFWNSKSNNIGVGNEEETKKNKISGNRKINESSSQETQKTINGSLIESDELTTKLMDEKETLNLAAVQMENHEGIS